MFLWIFIKKKHIIWIIGYELYEKKNVKKKNIEYRGKSEYKKKMKK